ncbi:hypothetical protein [Pararhizobium sp. LjRoot238]|uniref:hypothetical protein n=1 Tax=Pararhizobium sp. LjRoot238 TaxID=3342293 RepID=UPI003ECD7C0B
MSRKVVKLSRRYEPPGVVPFDTVELREPAYADRHMSGLGMPQEWQPNGQGGGVLMTYPGVVDEYLQRLIVSPGYEHKVVIKTPGNAPDIIVTAPGQK